jgi:hypothetical protein
MRPAGLGRGFTAFTLALTMVACSPTSGDAPGPSAEPQARPSYDIQRFSDDPTDDGEEDPDGRTEGTVSPSAAHPATEERHVAPEGDDDDPGTAERPWATISHAFTQLEPGTTLLVHDGTYEERVDLELHPGRADAPITVVAAPDARPVIEGVLWLRNPSYWRFDGLDVTWDRRSDDEDHMVKLLGGEGWEFSGAELSEARSYAALLVAESPKDWAVRGNCIHDTYPTNRANQDQLIYVNSGLDATEGVIEHNLLFNASNGTGIKLGGPREDSGGAADIRVRYNTIVGAAQSIMISWRSQDIVVERNLLGRTTDNYGAIRSYQLTGERNVASQNVAFDVAELFLSDEGYPGVEDAGGNQLVDDPRFDEDATCAGFRPQEPRLSGYGHTAAETGAQD